MESVGLLINAETESERVAALKGLSGSLRVRIEELAERVMTLLTPLELSIDFSDQDIEIVDVDDAQLRLTALIKEVDEMIASRRSRALGRGGYRVVLVGAANAGKSTLFNRLLGRDAAITSDESGTTRDYLEGDIEVGGVRFRLVDTAGVDQTSAGVEEAAAHLRDLEIESADITLVVAKGTDPAAIMGSVWGAHLLVRTHADVTEAVDRTEAPDKPDTVWVSGLTGAGIGELQEAIRQRAGCLQVARSGGLVLNQRHAEALGRCGGALRRAAEGLLGDDVVELVAADLREALHELERINGRDYDEELLDGILRDFCIGK
jgi:tRNA modification GTPase